jgi:hypothetical protein
MNTKYEFVSGDEKVIEPGRTVKRHGLRYTPEYGVWCGIIQRCKNKNSKDYKAYGALGIEVCDEWLSFQYFYRDMGARPEGFQIDRIDNLQGYSKENCRWVNRETNCRNRKTNRLVKFNGELVTVTEASIKSGISRKTITSRIDRGDAEIFATPKSPTECAYMRITRDRN